MKKLLPMPNALFSILLLLFITALNGCKSAQKEFETANPPVKESWLFTQTADSGTMFHNQSDNTYTITLHGAAPIMVKFTDTPVRKANTIKTDLFVRNWNRMFKDGNPNAAVVALFEGLDGHIEEAGVCTIQKVAYDPKTSIMTYTVKGIPGEKVFIIDKEGKPIHKIPSTFGPIVMFIDSGEINEFYQPATFDLTIDCSTKSLTNFDPDQIFIFYKAQTWDTFGDKELTHDIILTFNPDGSFNSFIDIENAGLKDISAYVYPMSCFQNNGFPKITLKDIPGPFRSGRVYLSIGAPITFDIQIDGDGVNRINDPSATSTTDTNYRVLFDKVEVTLDDQNVLYINQTAVDFLGLPLYIKVDKTGETVGCTYEISEVWTRLDDLIKNSGFNQDDQDTWNNLILKDNMPPKGKQPITLRIANIDKLPGSVIPDTFAYLDPYIDQVWDFYNGSSDDRKLRIDCSRIANDDKASADEKAIIAGTNGIMTGYVKNNSWLFTSGNGQEVSLDGGKPTTLQVFGAAPIGPLYGANHTIKSILGAYIGSLLNVGMLPLPSNINGTPASIFIIGQNTFTKPVTREMFNLYWPVTPPRGTSDLGNKYYNLYHKWLHQKYTDKMYAFAYDDYLGMDSTIGDGLGSGGHGSVTLYLGDIFGAYDYYPEARKTQDAYTVVAGIPAKHTLMVKEGDNYVPWTDMKKRSANLFIQYGPDGNLKEYELDLNKGNQQGFSIQIPSPVEGAECYLGCPN